MKLLAIVSMLVLGLAACGGGGSEVESLDDLGQMLEKAGVDCSEMEADSEEMLVKEGGSCGDYTAYVFNDSENRDNYLEIAEGFGGGPYVVGDNWVVQSPDQDQAEDLAEEMDAEVR